MRISIRSKRDPDFHTSYISEDELQDYYLVRTKSKPHYYRVGAGKSVSVPKLYKFANARQVVDTETEEIVPFYTIAIPSLVACNSKT